MSAACFYIPNIQPTESSKGAGGEGGAAPWTIGQNISKAIS